MFTMGKSLSVVKAGDLGIQKTRREGRVRLWMYLFSGTVAQGVPGLPGHSSIASIIDWTTTSLD